MTKSRRSVDSADAAVGEMSGEILRLNQRVSDMGKYVRSLCPRGLGSRVAPIHSHTTKDLELCLLSMDLLSSKRKIVFALFNSVIDVGDCVACCMRVSHMGVFHMSVFHLFWCNVPVHVAQKPARKGTQVFTNIWSVQIDIISHSLRRASSQNGTSHEGHEESSRCHWFNCQSCVHEGCRVHRAEAKSGQKEVAHERPAAKSRKSHVNKATATKLATARGPAATSFLEAHGLRMHRQLAHATEGYEEGSSTCSTSHEEESDEGHEEVRSCLSIVGRPVDQRPAVTR